MYSEAQKKCRQNWRNVFINITTFSWNFLLILMDTPMRVAWHCCNRCVLLLWDPPVHGLCTQHRYLPAMSCTQYRYLLACTQYRYHPGTDTCLPVPIPTDTCTGTYCTPVPACTEFRRYRYLTVLGTGTASCRLACTVWYNISCYGKTLSHARRHPREYRTLRVLPSHFNMAS